jgi:two-component system NarL family response regulator
MRILLVDDHALFLEGLADLLTTRGFQVVGTARDGQAALAAARALQPDLILMDIQMPRCDGLTATRLIKSEMPEVKIVMLTMSETDQDLFEAIKSGASGYLIKSLDADRFCEMLPGLAEGEAPLSRGLAAKILKEFANQANRPEPAAPSELTPRQLEVLSLVAEGLSYKQVGEALYLTERTVKYHMSEILKALHLKNRAQVVAYAMRKGMLKAAPPNPDAK